MLKYIIIRNKLSAIMKRFISYDRNYWINLQKLHLRLFNLNCIYDLKW